MFGLPDNNTSYTYTATETNPPDNPLGAAGLPPRQLLPAGTAGHQTVAVLSGAASVTASSAGSWLWEIPQADPVNAFDDDPSSAWTEATPQAAGQWIQVSFDHPLSLSGPVAIRLLDDVPRPVATQLVVTTATGRAVTDTQVTGAAQPLNIPSGRTSWLRITIAASRGGIRGGPGAGISDAAIPGVRITRFLQPSQQPGPAPSFSFERDTATTGGLPGVPPEPALNRTFTVPSAQRYTLSASVVAVPGTALNTLLDDLGSGKPPQLTIAASSTFGSVPALRPQNLLGATATGWIAGSPDATLHLQWTGRRTVSSVQLTPYSVGIAAQPTQVEISSPPGSRDLPIPQTGIVTFPPLITDQLTISFPDVMHVTAYNPLVGKSQQLPVGLAGLSIPALAGLSTGLPQPADALHARLRAGAAGDGGRPHLRHLRVRDGRRPDQPHAAAAEAVHPRVGAAAAGGQALADLTGNGPAADRYRSQPEGPCRRAGGDRGARRPARAGRSADGQRHRPGRAACGSARGEPSTGPPRSAPGPGPTSRSTRPPARAGPRP